MSHETDRTPPAVTEALDGESPECPDCGHVTGDHGWRPFRALTLRLARRPHLRTCGSTQSYEDDELGSCGCRNAIHSN